MAHLLAHCIAACISRSAGRIRIELRAHTRRIRCGADDRRQHPRRNADRIDTYLRSGPSLELQSCKPDRAAAAGPLLSPVGSSLRAAPPEWLGAVGLALSDTQCTTTD